MSPPQLVARRILTTNDERSESPAGSPREIVAALPADSRRDVVAAMDPVRAVADVFLTDSERRLTGTGVSLVLSMVAAGIAGVLVPTVLTMLGQDPAQSSSIVLTTVTDVAGFASILGLELHLPLYIGRRTGTLQAAGDL